MTEPPPTAASRPADRTVPPLAGFGVAVIAALGTIALLLSLDRYGYFGDELYFMAAGERLDVGYADQGPLLPAVAHLMDVIAPGSLFMLRLPAALLTIGAIVMAALIARELGGRSAAQLLTAGAYATSPLLLGQGALLSTNTVDTALWTLVTWLVVRWVRTRADWLLLLAAVVTAVDFQVKWLIPFFWICVGISVLILGPREMLRRPVLWIGAAIVVASALPSLRWQAERGWPQLKMGAVIAAEQDTVMGRSLFVPLALASAGALGAVLLLYGTWRLFRAPELRPYRFLALSTLLLVLVFQVQGGRLYYVAGMFAILMAAGAVDLTRRNLRPWVKWSLAPLVAASLAATVYALPWQPVADIGPADTVAEQAAGLTINGKFGWPELAAATGDAYRKLPPEVAARTVVIADSYWQASAIDQLGSDLPPVYSASRGFWYFGTPPDSASTVLYVGSDQPPVPSEFASVRRMATVDVPLGLPGVTRGIGVWRCDRPAKPWSTSWPQRNELTPRP